MPVAVFKAMMKSHQQRVGTISKGQLVYPGSGTVNVGGLKMHKIIHLN